MELTFERISSLGLTTDTNIIDELIERYQPGAVECPDETLFEAIGANVSSIAFERGHEPVVLFARNDDYFLPAIQEFRQARPTVPICLLDDNKMASLIGINFIRGFVGIFRRMPLPNPMDVLKDARFVLVVENEESSGQIGNLVRSAAAFWVDAVLISSECASPYQSSVIRGSTGNIFRMPFGVVEVTGEELDSLLQKAGFMPLRLFPRPDENAINLERVPIDDTSRIALVYNGKDFREATCSTEALGKRVYVPAKKYGCPIPGNTAAIAMWVLSGKMQSVSV